jgi:hypothetical protein
VAKELSFVVYLSRSIVAAAMACVAFASPAFAEIQWSDTNLSFRYLWQDKQPGYAGNVPEAAFNISYANAWTYGSNFVSLDLENFGHQDPANTVGGHASSDSFEFYGLFRAVASGNKISGTNNFAFGPFSDVGFEVGADVDTQDDQFASYKRLIVFGPQFTIAMPKGFWTISLHLSHEWNTNAYLKDNSTNFDIAPEFESAWMYPFTIGEVPLKFTGFINIIAPKGKGAPDDTPHGWEILAHPKLMVDVGALLGGKPNTFEAGVGYEYWYNKFGNQAQYLPGTQQNAFFVEAGYHF